MQKFLLIALLVMLSGCQTRGLPRELVVAPGQYAQAFESTRQVLRESGFQIERVDARLGVITTGPRGIAGNAPLTAHPQTIAEDLLSEQKRVVRVSFEPASTAARIPVQTETGAWAIDDPEPTRDLRSSTEDLVMRLRVVVERVNRPGWQVETDSIRTSRRWISRDLVNRNMQPSYAVAIREDARMSRILTERVREKIAGE